MTPVLSRGELNPLSRITVATLEDIGYTVDYNEADSYTSTDLDPSCICDRRDRSLSVNVGDAKYGRDLIDTRDFAIRSKAIKFGEEILQERIDDTVSGRIASKGESVSNTLSVLYRKHDGSIGDVIVSIDL